MKSIYVGIDISKKKLDFKLNIKSILRKTQPKLK
jgi:hypothetical protein